MTETVDHIQEQIDAALACPGVVRASLESVFRQEREIVAVNTRRRIDLKSKIPGQKIDVTEEVRFSIRQWEKEKLQGFAYGRYKKIMEEEGKNSYSLKRFLQPSMGGEGPSAYDRFRCMEEKGFKIGERVIYTPPKTLLSQEVIEEAGVIIRMQVDCYLRMRLDNGEETGGRNPYFMRKEQ